MLAPLKFLGVIGLALQSVSAVTPWQKLDAKDFKLTQTGYSSLIKALDKVLPNVSVKTVLDNANHAMSISGGNYKWPDQSGFNDFATEKWYPQGITTTGDAYASGLYEGKRAILTSWYSKESPDKGVRISFIDVSAGSHGPSYRHALLVEPTGTASAPSFKPVNVHAGGIMLYGNMLYVVDTSGGLRLFDLNHIYQVKDGVHIGRQSSTVYEAYGYKYVIPQARRYLSKGRPSSDSMSYSYISLDRTTTPDSLVVGEYKTGTSARTARFSLDYKTRLLHTDSHGEASATQAFHFGYERIQGICSIKNRWYLSQSNGGSKGDLFAYTPGQSKAKQYTGHFPTGPEDLSYDQTTGTLWTLTEHPNHRYIVGTQIKDFP